MKTRPDPGGRLNIPGSGVAKAGHCFWPICRGQDPGAEPLVLGHEGCWAVLIEKEEQNLGIPEEGRGQRALSTRDGARTVAENRGCCLQSSNRASQQGLRHFDAVQPAITIALKEQMSPKTHQTQSIIGGFIPTAGQSNSTSLGERGDGASCHRYRDGAVSDRIHKVLSGIFISQHLDDAVCQSSESLIVQIGTSALWRDAQPCRHGLDPVLDQLDCRIDGQGQTPLVEQPH